MIYKRYKKQPGEVETVGIDWTNRIDQLVPAGYSIASVSVSVFDSDGNNVTNDMIEGIPGNVGYVTYFTLKGGVSGKTYYAKVQITVANLGYTTLTLEEDLTVIVEEVGY